MRLTAGDRVIYRPMRSSNNTPWVPVDEQDLDGLNPEDVGYDVGVEKRYRGFVDVNVSGCKATIIEVIDSQSIRIQFDRLPPVKIWNNPRDFEWIEEVGNV